MPRQHTIGHLARSLGLPDWKVRRVVDALGVDIPRAGLYRLIPDPLVPAIVEALRKRRWLKDSEEVARVE